MARPATTPRPRPRSGGFTLMEILVVVVILGILAAIVIPQFANAQAGAQISTFVMNLNEFNKGALIMKEETGVYPDDSGSGQVPAGLGPYIDTRRWESGTPINGVWDSEGTTYGFAATLGVHFNVSSEARDDAYMQEVDALIDDGVLTEGIFRRFEDDRFYLIVDRRTP